MSCCETKRENTVIGVSTLISLSISLQAVVSCWYTVLSDQDTWNHLIFLTVVCFVTMFIVIISDSVKSVYDDNAVVNKALTLVSFVFAGYVSIVINRWDRIRNATIGKTPRLMGTTLSLTQLSV